MFDVIRRVILSLVGFVLCAIAGYQFAWHKDAFHIKDSMSSLAWLLLVIIFIGLILWMALDKKMKHAGPKVVFAAVLGGVAVAWGKDVLEGIKFDQLLILGGIAAAVIVFVTAISLDALPFTSKSKN
jgi:hypothetical protein